jgi:hypothetical protein
MINNLKWETLEQRRMRAKVTMFYKITNNVVAIDPNDFEFVTLDQSFKLIPGLAWHNNAGW